MSQPQNVVAAKCRATKCRDERMLETKNVVAPKSHGSIMSRRQYKNVVAPESRGKRVPMVSVAYKRPRKDIGLSLFKLVARRAAAFPFMSIFVIASSGMYASSGPYRIVRILSYIGYSWFLCVNLVLLLSSDALCYNAFHVF
jgi:hypothetical protein